MKNFSKYWKLLKDLFSNNETINKIYMFLFLKVKNIDLRAFLTNLISQIKNIDLRAFLKILILNKKVIILFIFGLTQIIWILYNRFRIREIKELPIIFNPGSMILYILLTISYSITLLIIIYSFLPLKKKEIKSKIIKICIKYLGKLIELYSLAMDTVYQQIIVKVPYHNTLLTKLAHSFKYLEPYHFWIHLILVVLCPIIPAICLTIDVFYFYQLNWFYKSLILFLIPLLVRFFLYMLEDLTLPPMLYLQKVSFTISIVTVNGNFRHKYTKIDNDRSYKQWEYDIQYFESCTAIMDLVFEFRNLSLTWYTKLGRCLQYVLYLISWGYLAYLQILLY